MPTAAPVLWNLVEEHLDEAAFLATQWARALASPQYTVDAVAKRPEARLLAHVDGLLNAGGSISGRLLEPALLSSERGRVLAAGLTLLELPGRQGLDALLHQLRSAKPDARAPLIRALELAHRPGIERDLLALAQSGDNALVGPTLSALALRRIPVPEESLTRVLASEQADVLPPALRAARGGGPRLKSLVERRYGSSDAAVRDAALACGLALGFRSAWASCQELAKAKAADSKFALLALSLSNEASDVERIVRVLAEDALRPRALFALGFTGRVAAAEACLPYLEDKKTGRLAGEAFSAITGLSIEKQYRRADELPDEPIPLKDEDLAANLVPGPEDELPLARKDAVTDWWKSAKPRFDPAVRYLGGKPFTAPTLLASFTGGSMRRRQVLSLELAVRSRGEYDVETLGWAADQIRAQAAKKLAARPDFLQPFGQLLRA